MAHPARLGQLDQSEDAECMAGKAPDLRVKSKTMFEKSDTISILTQIYFGKAAYMQWLKGLFRKTITSDRKYSEETASVMGEVSLALEVEIEFIALFSKAIDLQKAFAGHWGEYWALKLGQSPHGFVEKLLSEGKIRQANTRERLHSTLTVSKLKGTLRSEGLKVSGKKSELVDRILAELPHRAKALSGSTPMLIATDESQEQTAILKADKAREYELAIQKSLDALKKRDYQAAAKIVTEYEVRQFHQRGMGVD